LTSLVDRYIHDLQFKIKGIYEKLISLFDLQKPFLKFDKFLQYQLFIIDKCKYIANFELVFNFTKNVLIILVMDRLWKHLYQSNRRYY